MGIYNHFGGRPDIVVRLCLPDEVRSFVPKSAAYITLLASLVLFSNSSWRLRVRNLFDF